MENIILLDYAPYIVKLRFLLAGLSLKLPRILNLSGAGQK